MQAERTADPSQRSLELENSGRGAMEEISLVDERSRARHSLSGGGVCTMGPGEQHGWKPATMGAPVLLPFALLTVLIIAFVELLAQLSMKQGGLSLVDNADQLPATVIFAYLYLPVMLAVAYGLLFNWIDLDVKRIFPWLQLSRPAGAKGKDSLFLHYEFNFAAWVPFKAAARRHWMVTLSGTIICLITFVITPLHSAFLGTDTVLISQEVQMTTISQFIDPVAQGAALDVSVLNAAFAITWLDQPYPAFTTADYTLLPFNPPESSQGDVANWTGVTTKYWTELRCWPAKVSNDEEGIHFDNGQGCVTSQVPLMVELNRQNVYYAGYYADDEVDIYLQCSRCGRAAANQFLAIWYRSASNNYSDITSEFCETSYHKQKVKATIQADGLVPIDDLIEPLGPAEPLLATEFNSSAFEWLLGVGVSRVQIPRDYPFNILLDQQTRIQDRKAITPLWSPMVPFALGMTDAPLDAFSDPDFMKSVFQAVHRRMFSTAFPSLLGKSSGTSNETGEIFIVKYGVVVSRFYSMLIEIFLGVVTALVLVLWWCCHQSPSMLSEDPHTLGHLLSFVQNSPLLLKFFRSTGGLDHQELKAKLRDCDFRLVCGCQDISGERTLRLVGGNRASMSAFGVGPCQARVETEDVGHYQPVKPKALRHMVGVVFAILLATAIVVLGFLRYQDQAIGGLALPSSNFDVNKLLISYLPTIFASILVEPFWLVLCRMLCLLQPFYDLLADRGTAQRTINAGYTGIPAQFAMWQAFQSGSMLLGLVCFSVSLGSVLSVGLGAFFEQRPVPTSHPWQMSRQALSSVVGMENYILTLQPMLDHVYTAMANLSYGTPLPAWTTPDLAFLPVNLSSQTFEKDITYSAETVGFGVEPSCKSLGTFLTENVPPMIDPTLADPDGNFTYCERNKRFPSMEFRDDPAGNLTGMYTSEVVSTFTEGNVEGCYQWLALGWARSDVSTIADGKGRKNLGVINSTFVICSPVPTVSEYRIDFDYQGRILGAARLQNASSSFQRVNSTIHIPDLTKALNYEWQIPGNNPWHNDSVSQDIFSSLLKLQSGVNSLFDPSSPRPDPEQLLPSITKLYKLMHAIVYNSALASLTDPSQEPIVGTRIVEETRVFISSPAFYASIVSLVLYLLVTVAFYISGVRFAFPRLPHSIGSRLAYIAPSSLANGSSDPKALFEDMEYKTFRFGTLTGPDGKEYIGIDYSDRVTPIDAASFTQGPRKRKLWSKFRGNLGRKEQKADLKKEYVDDNWI